MSEEDKRFEKMNQLINGTLADEEKDKFLLRLTEDKTLVNDWNLFQIEQYLDGNLEGVWKENFEKELSQNENLMNDLQWHRQQQSLLKSAAEETLKAELKTLLPQKKESAKRRFLVNRKYLVMAAALVGAVIISTLFIFQKPKSHQQLFADYYEEYPMILTARSDDPNTIAYDAAIKAYLAKDHINALRAFEELNAANPQTLIYRFYIGVLALKTADYEKAIAYLLPLQKDASIGEPSEWYLSLAYLAAGKKEETRKILNQIKQNSNHYYQTKAGELIEEGW